VDTPSESATAARPIGSGAIILISSSFTWRKSKQRHHAAGLGQRLEGPHPVRLNRKEK
jgi:hypothetical protein